MTTQSGLSVHIVIAVESELALLPLGSNTIAGNAVNRALGAGCKPTVSVWVNPALRDNWNSLDKRQRQKYEVETADSLFEVAQDLKADVLMIHDAQRPLTLSSTFDRVADHISNEVTSARPAHVVVDTLKIVDENRIVTGTVNRDTVQSLTSPEGYLRAAITGRNDNGWTFTTGHGSTELVRGDQESLKVRNPEDVQLVESFLVWQTQS
ncbi:MAG: 2-C-methyl-D-erythritol 4-phosphate cytidylyltransferase [Actinomycetota bacterium]|jgi:2-C-methyl-D-erythritol 4-phosphate cytidylyltransferase